MSWTVRYIALSVIFVTGTVGTRFAEANIGDGVDFGGWMAGGFYDNSHGLSGPAANTPLGFNNIGDEFQLHQAWMYLGKEAQTGNGIDFGFRVDFMFGSDAPDTQAFGDGSWDASWITDNSGDYGFAMPQLYSEVALGDTVVKMGHFYTIIGYEVVQAPQNFFYSHAYTMVYNEPRTHTGILAQTPLGSHIKAYYGWTRGWDSGFENRQEGSTFLGGLGLEITDKMTLNWGTSFGDPGDVDAATGDVFLSSFVLDWKPVDAVEYVVQTDFQSRQTTAAVGGQSAFKQYGLNQYLFLYLTDAIAAGMRYEWFYVGEGIGLPLNTAVGTPGGHYHAVTMGLNMNIGGMLIKPEMRYDWVDHDAGFAPFDGNVRQSQFTWGAQSIMTF